MAMIDDIIRLIKQRDHLSIKEARIMVDDCVAEIRNEIENGADIDAIEDILASYLGLEPDYLPAIIEDLI